MGLNAAEKSSSNDSCVKIDSNGAVSGVPIDDDIDVVSVNRWEGKPYFIASNAISSVDLYRRMSKVINVLIVNGRYGRCDGGGE